MIDRISPTLIVDADHRRVQAFAEAGAEGADDDRDRAIELYYAVRDGS